MQGTDVDLSLQEYVNSMLPGSAAKEKNTRLNRPFDAPTYDKTHPPFGIKAKQLELSPDGLDIINLEQIDESLITKVKKSFKDLLDDLSAMQLPEGKEEAIKSGYIFNAYNKYVVAPALSTASPEKVAVIKQQTEILRLISDNLDQSEKEILSRIKQSNQKKIDSLCLSTIAAGVGEGKDKDEKFNTEDSKTRLSVGQQLGNVIDTDLLKARMNDYIEVGGSMMDRAFGVTKPGKPSVRDKFPGVQLAIVEAWARIANQIQYEINANTNQLNLYTAQQSSYVRETGEAKFNPVADFVHDILTIQLNYEARWAGLKERFTDKESEGYKFKLEVIKNINKKLEDMLAQFPHNMDIKTMREQMNQFLMEQKIYLRENQHSKSELFSHIDRVISKFGNLQADKSKKNVFDKFKERVIKAREESKKEPVNDKIINVENEKQMK